MYESKRPKRRQSCSSSQAAKRGKTLCEFADRARLRQRSKYLSFGAGVSVKTWAERAVRI